MLTDNIYLGRDVIASIQTSTEGIESISFHHSDALGSRVATTQADGALLRRTSYSAYGSSDLAANDSIGYTGHIEDAATDMVYMQQRYYSSELKRFISTDPIAAIDNHTGANNRYSYADNNPFKFVNPDGRKSALPLYYQTTSREKSGDGTVIVSRQGTTNNGIVGGNTVENRGTVVMLKQDSLAGAPATTGGKVTTQLLNFSDIEGKTVEVTSGQRTVEQNARVRGASASQHLRDNAADIRIRGYTRTQTADAAHASGQFNRVNEYPDSRGVHVDLKESGSQGRFYNWMKRNEN